MFKLVKFVVGGLLVAISLVFGFALITGGSILTTANPDTASPLLIWGVIDLIVFLVGVFLIRI